MKGKLIWNLMLVIILNLVIKPFYILGIDAEVINRVGASVYGNYFALINFSFLLNIILDLGITNYNVKNIAQHHHLLDKYFSGIITLRFLLVLIYLVLTFIIAIFIGYDVLQLKILLLLALNQSLVAFILYIRSNLTGLHLFVQDSLISVLDRLLLIIICSFLLWGGVTNQPFQIEWFIYAQTLSYGVTLLTCFVLVLLKTSHFKLQWSPAFSIIILKHSFPYALLILLMTVYYRIDSVMLERMLDDNSTQAGIYAQAYRFFEASNMFAYLFAGLLLPIFSRMLKNKDSVVELVDFAFKTLMSFAFIIAIFCWFYNYQIIDFRYDNYITESSLILKLLMICFLFISSTYIYGTLLTANGNLYYLNIVAGIGVVLNIGLNLILIPKYYAFGSAIASLVTQALTALAQLFICISIFELNVQKSFLRLLVFVFGLIAFCVFLNYFLPFSYYHLVLYIVFSVSWLFMTRLIDWSDLNLLIENRFKIK